MKTMDEKNSQLEILLKKIDELKTEHAKEDVFNAFQILRLNDKEVMHSRFIKSLLNPNENHGFKDGFLKLFLKRINIENFSTNGVTTECEKNTHNNRYIDIAIENKTSRQMIIIENKIWAGDLDNQLFDYHNYGLNLYENKSENIFMIYLTPYGKPYGNNSFPREKEQPKNGIKCISYEKDILEWLNDCLCLVRIGSKENRIYLCIKMYIELIRKTINRDEYMEEILKHLANNPSQMEVAIDVVKALQGRNLLEIIELRSQIIKNIKTALENVFDTEKVSKGENEDVFYIEKYDEDGEQLSIDIEDKVYARLGNKESFIENNLNNEYLIALLTNNQYLIQEWITKTTNKLTGEAENL